MDVAGSIKTSVVTPLSKSFCFVNQLMYPDISFQLINCLSASLHQDGPLYSYTVITVGAHADFACIHDRMPAILDGDAAIGAWLDPDITTQEAIKALHASPSLTWYPVSEVVNNVRNKSPECIMKIDPRYVSNGIGQPLNQCS
jgi:hypothetical protein